MFPHNNEGRNELHKVYDGEQFQEIADNGCESGVFSEHIYYVDTINFFNKYEGEVLDLIHTRYGVDTLVEIFKQHDACYDAYRNDCVWLFIENVATDYVIEMEELQEKEDAIIASYMKEDTVSGFNPPGSMTDLRYAQV